MKKTISLTVAAAMAAAVLPAYNAAAAVGTTSVEYKYGDVTYTRQMEKLGRGLIAVNTGSGIYLGWRLLGDEGSVTNIRRAPVFDIYRNGTKIATVSDSTNYLDRSGRLTDTYSVAPTTTGVKCDAVSVRSNSYFDIGLDRPAAVTLADGNTYEYGVNDASCGDIDGDGEYEIILKWDCNGKDNSHEGYTGNVLIDAYKLDGTKLWRIDLGQNIRAGAHYTQFLVYDFDGDGKAELACKTAPGSKDSAGKYVTKASHDASISAVTDEVNETSYANSGGRILDGDEYYTVFASDGTAIDTIAYPFPRGNISTWGNNEGYGNRVDRFLGAVAYLDGVHPYMISLRGYYGKTTVAAMRLNNGKLSVEKTFTTDEAGTQYEGQGNHNITVADVDNDGKDEVITGAICWDDDLSIKWCSGRGHGDALHIGDYDPTHEGFEYFSVHESGGYEITGSTTSSQGQTADYGMTVYDAATGEELFHAGNTKDTGRGMMANVGAGGYYQINGVGNYIANGGTNFTQMGSSLSNNFRVFWDADLYDELLDGTGITAWDGSRMSTIFTADGCVSINGTKANPALQADLFGDWREEVCYPLSDNSAIRVFTTTDVTDYKLPTLMHDPVYRSGVAAEQTAYNQPPHIGFYLSGDMYEEYVEYELTDGERSYTIDYDFSESDFDGFKLTQSTSGQTQEIGNITFGVGSRPKDPDGTSGFEIGDSNGDPYLVCGVGQFASNGRNGYMNITNTPAISAEYDNVLSFRFMIPYTTSKYADATTNVLGYLSIRDAQGQADEISIDNLKVEYDTWYSYALVSHDGWYYRLLFDADGAFISRTKIKKINSDSFISSITALQCEGAGGAFRMGSGTYIALDDLKLYSTDTAFTAVEPTPEPTATPTPEPTATPTPEPTATPTPEPTATPTPEPTATPTPEPTATPTPEPTATPTPEPTATPTPEPTATPTPEPTATPTPEPTATPTPEPTATPTATPDTKLAIRAERGSDGEGSAVVSAELTHIVSGTIIIAEYDGSGRLTGVVTKETEAEETDYIIVLPAAENSIIKAMLWDGLLTQRALTQAANAQ